VEAFRRRFEARWVDLDVNRHLRNTAYADYATDVRIAFLRERGFPLAEFERHGFGPVILREEARYLREISPGEAFEVDFQVAGLSPDAARWHVLHEFRRGDGKRAALLRLEGLWLDLTSRRPRLPPVALAEALRCAPRAKGFEELPLLSQSENGPPGS
jgi:acyl-CoA thioester hydrolase